MTDEEQIKQVLYDFEDGGLVSRNIDKVLGCISDEVIGIGIGEQGFISSRDQIQSIFLSEIRAKDHAVYSLRYNRVEILIHGGVFANLCADISIFREEEGTVTQSHLLQSLVFIKEGGAWKICGLHASAPELTMENVAAYPLKYAEKILQDLRTEIGEEAYEAEEQYRMAILSDTVAFYIINFTGDCFEQCQLNNPLCAYTEPETPYDQFIKETLPEYVDVDYREEYLKKFSLENIRKAIEKGEKELSCEYKFLCPDGSKIWMVTVVRMITDCITGEHKGIMYVKDIDQQKRREIEMTNKAERDVMTGLYNRASFNCQMERLLSISSGAKAFFVMIDVDHFKTINDTFGHPAGDQVLIETAMILGDCFGAKALIGRLGGDEFGVLLTEVRKTELEEASKRFLKQMERIQVDPDHKLKISCSMGAVLCEAEDDFLKVYEKADQALYCSKRNGRNRFSYYGH